MQCSKCDGWMNGINHPFDGWLRCKKCGREIKRGAYNRDEDKFEILVVRVEGTPVEAEGSRTLGEKEVQS